MTDVKIETSERALLEASAWRVHLTEAGTDSTAEFEAWLAADASHAAAWRRVEASWDYVGAHAAEPELLGARSAALGITPGFGRPPPPRVVPWRSLFAASVLAVAAAIAGFEWWTQPIDYQTALGERRTLVLPDGSRLSLDSNSEVRVALGSTERDLALVRGQARFEVAHDHARPFHVVAEGVTVTATGTDFDVDLPSHGVSVALLQGHVSVSSAQGSAELDPGYQLLLVDGRKPTLSAIGAADILGWEAGQVTFHNTSLSDVVARLNRYDRDQLVIADPAIASRRVSGTFNLGNASAIADILTQYLGIRADAAGEGRIALRR